MHLLYQTHFNMCLTIAFQKEAKIAKRDIVIYKWLNPQGKHYKSPYRGYFWKIGLQVNSKFGITIRGLGGGFMQIHEGLHAYTNFRKAKKKYDGTILVKGIIPKGAEYYKGKGGIEIAASSMILHEEVYRQG